MFVGCRIALNDPALKIEMQTKHEKSEAKKRVAEQMEFAYGIFVFTFQVQRSGVHLHVLSAFNQNRMNSAVAW